MIVHRTGEVGISHYDSRRRIVFLSRDATLYQRWHELEHARQHEERCLVWRLWRLTRFIPWLSKKTRYLLELDALQRTEKAIRKAGLWSEEIEQEAIECLETYR